MSCLLAKPQSLLQQPGERIANRFPQGQRPFKGRHPLGQVQHHQLLRRGQSHRFQYRFASLQAYDATDPTRPLQMLGQRIQGARTLALVDAAQL